MSIQEKSAEQAPVTVETKPTIAPSMAILTVIVSFILVVFGGAVIMLLFGIGPSLVFGELLIIAAPLAYMLSHKINIRDYIGIQLNGKTIALGLAFGGVLLLVDIVVSGVLTTVFGESQAVIESNKIIADLAGSPTGLVYVALGLFLAGICEEFTFRAFLLNSINRKYSFIPALLVSSLAFGLFHFDPQIVYILSTFLAGLVLGYIYYRYNSYLTNAIAHSTLNLIVLIVIVFALA